MIQNLPRDIALDILSRLPISSLDQIQYVCKTWYGLTRDRSLPIVFNAHASNRNPGLILHSDCLKQNKLYFLENSDGADQCYSNKVRRIDAKLKSFINEYQIVGSCNGLICLADALYFNPMIVCNPLTGNVIELPKANEYPRREVALGFGYHPTTKEYKVVRLLYSVNIHHGIWSMKSDFQVLTLGTKTWRRLESLPLSLDQNPSKALLNGALHWVTARNKTTCFPGPGLKIISFDLANETFREIPLPSCGSLDVCNFELVVLGQCLSAAVCHSDGSTEIWRMKEYGVKESWIKDYVIRAYMPISLNPTAASALMYARPWKKSTESKGVVQVVCILKNGVILLQYMKGAFVLYNPVNKEFKDLVIPGLPKWFCTIAHVESLSFDEIWRN
ncbi:hypothetical protein COLO4_25431 [Corchorus olitorius]|uniref:F-box domain-containing protein n=1 Tax=Corchorus olitorius TaxID=93759 RepID=A0A1R3I2U9_9ROSI|nr:hypothetical protein COLO4_25431 [Corchorus olitorius]